MASLVHTAGPGSLMARALFGARTVAWPAVGSLRLDPAPLADTPPRPELRRLRVRLGGICGSDLAALRGRSPTVLWPVTSFPSVPGHEILADDPQAPAGARRVVVDPFISCRVRGIEPCPECARGQTALCRRTAGAGGGIDRGLMLGFCRSLPGAWSEAIWAHPAQLHVVPDDLPDAAAVLTEPLSVAVHALLQVPWTGAERVLVVGGGTIGLCTVAGMQLLGLPAPLVATRHRQQAAAVASLGGHPVIGDPGRWPRMGGAVVAQGWLGRPLWLGGFDVVIDAVGASATLAQAAQAVRAGGTLVRVGDVGTVPHGRDAGAWIPDVRLLQPFGYGLERLADGTSAHTFDWVLGRMAAVAGPLGALVTHTYPLGAYRQALAAAAGHGRARSIKVAFRPTA